MSRYPLKRGELLQEQSPRGWTVYEPETDSLHVLNASAKAIWELCDGNTSPSEIATAISELTGVDLERAKCDVEETLDRLSTLRLVTD